MHHGDDRGRLDARRRPELGHRSARSSPSTLRRRSYAEAPVSPLQLFDRQQDFAYQQEVAGSPSKRHHVRFWRAPRGGCCPVATPSTGSRPAPTTEASGLSLFTLQITHKIEADTDVERDFIVDSRHPRQNPAVDVEVIRNFSTGYHSRNGGGDLIETDGDLPDRRPPTGSAPRPRRRRRAHRQPGQAAGTDRLRRRGDLRPRCRLSGAGGHFLGFAGPAAAELVPRPMSVRRLRAEIDSCSGAWGDPARWPACSMSSSGWPCCSPATGHGGADADLRGDHHHRVHRQRPGQPGRQPDHEPAAGRHEHPGAARPVQPPGKGLCRAGGDTSPSGSPAGPRSERRSRRRQHSTAAA